MSSKEKKESFESFSDGETAGNSRENYCRLENSILRTAQSRNVRRKHGEARGRLQLKIISGKSATA